jgi:AcrR family transcriptional regulator
MPTELTRRDQKRAEIVEMLGQHLLAHGLGDSGIRRLARVAGTSDRMLLYYFANKEEILSAVLERIAAGLAESLEAILGSTPLPPARALERVWEFVKRDANADPLRQWLDCASRAIRGDPFFREVVANIGEGWIAWLGAALAAPAEDRAALAALMMAAVDGQVVLHPTDLSEGDAAIATLVRLLEGLAHDQESPP